MSGGTFVGMPSFPEAARTSPLLHAHINPFGQYRFDLARMRRA